MKTAPSVACPDSNNTEVKVVLAADDRYAMPLAVAVRSMAANFRDPRGLHIYILCWNISAGNRARIEQSLHPHAGAARLTFLDPDIGRIQTLPTGYKRFSSPVYLRLLIPDALPAECGKAIYLDSDLVVLGNLGDLWQTDISDVALAAVTEENSYASDMFALHPEIGFAPDTKYFNSGVMVMNLVRWRQEEITTRAIDFARRSPHILRYPDQDSLNAVIGGNFMELPPSWNAWGFNADRPALNRKFWSGPQPHICHFVSKKPWQPGCLQPEAAIFFDYLDQTAWAGWRVPFVKNQIWLLRRRLRACAVALLETIGLKEAFKTLLRAPGKMK